MSCVARTSRNASDAAFSWALIGAWTARVTAEPSSSERVMASVAHGTSGDA